MSAVRGNLRIFDDVKHWWAIVNGRITREIVSEDLLATAGRTLDLCGWRLLAMEAVPNSSISARDRAKAKPWHALPASPHKAVSAVRPRVSRIC